MDEAIALLGALQAGLMAVLSYQARQLQALAEKVGELCGRINAAERKGGRIKSQ